MNFLNTYHPKGSFNVAGPPEYSSTESISKHSLYFMEKHGFTPIRDGLFAGWILILEQFNISKSTFDFYQDLNNQLEADGKLFDPLFVQARNNIECVTDSTKLVLGNFEISRKKETRYFVRYINFEDGYEIRPISNFYEIPKDNGTEDFVVPPIWWE